MASVEKDSLKIVLYGAVVYHLLDLLQSKLTVPASIVRLTGKEPPDELATICGDADVLVAINNLTLPPSPRLRLLQIPGAGLDQIDFARVRPEAFICNAYGHDAAGGEYVVLAMLAWCHQFVEAHESFKAGSWRMSGRFGAPMHDELRGKTVCIVGLGPIGLEAARLAKAFGTTVIAVNRSARDEPFLDEVYPLTDLRTVLPRADFVAICVAHAPETAGLIDREALALMKSDAVLINVARGAIVDEQALYDALRDRTIGGAVIDAWYQYPPADNLEARPSTLPFHELPNLLMTPHSAIWTRGMIERRWTSIARNIDAIGHGTPAALQNVVRASVVETR